MSYVHSAYGAVSSFLPSAAVFDGSLNGSFGAVILLRLYERPHLHSAGRLTGFFISPRQDCADGAAELWNVAQAAGAGGSCSENTIHLVDVFFFNPECISTDG